MVELAAAVAVASISLAAAAAAVTSGAKLARTTEETRSASRAAASVMERVRATPFDQVLTTFNGTTQPLSTLTVAGSGGTAAVSVADITTGSSRWHVLQVTVAAQWKGVSGTSNRTYVTYVCDRTTGSSLSGATSIPASGAF